MAQMFIRVKKEGLQIILGEFVDDPQGPQGSKLARNPGMGLEGGSEKGQSGGGDASIQGPLLKQPSALANVPFILVQEIAGQFQVGIARKIKGGQLGRVPINDFVDSSTRPVSPIIVVAFAEVIPVRDKDTTIGSILDGDSSKPSVFRREKGPSAAGHVAGLVTFQSIHHHAIPMNIVEEESAAVVGWPVFSEIDHASGVGMSATLSIVSLAASGFTPIRSSPVKMVGTGLEQVE